MKLFIIMKCYLIFHLILHLAIKQVLNISSNLASGNKAGKLTVTVVLTNITLEYLISLQESLSH